MTDELEKDKTETVQSSEIFIQKIKVEIANVDEKLDKLMTAYLENAVSLTEYQETKNKLINQKQLFKGKLIAFEQKTNNRFERAIKFINDSKNAKISAKDENLQSLRDCFKKVGSNFLIQNRAFSYKPRGAWRILEKQEPSAQSAEGFNSQNSDFEKMRYLLVKIRTYFEENPNED